jgi:hypothetical protein
LARERRLLFLRLVAAALVAEENAETTRDGDLCCELLRLGQAYGLLN